MKNKPISLNEFKTWFENQKDLNNIFSLNRDKIKDNKNEKFIGHHCESKVSEKKLKEKIKTDEDVEGLIRDFLESGGVITAVDEKRFSIETDSGSFTLPIFCVKVKK